jgi:tetratricopeptide (TPR) repeat protein
VPTSSFQLFFPVGATYRAGSLRFVGGVWTGEFGWPYAAPHGTRFGYGYTALDIRCRVGLPVAPYVFTDTATLVALAYRLDPELVSGILPPEAFPRETEPPAEPADKRELALQSLADGAYDEAAERLSALLDALAPRARPVDGGEATGDTARGELLRLHGLALAGAGQYDAAGGRFARAYEVAPSLKQTPFDGAEALGSDDALRNVVRRAVQHAHRAQTERAWFCVGVLMHAQGRHALANEMMERAEAAGAGGEDAASDSSASENSADSEANTDAQVEPNTSPSPAHGGRGGLAQRGR